MAPMAVSAVFPAPTGWANSTVGSETTRQTALAGGGEPGTQRTDRAW